MRLVRPRSPLKPFVDCCSTRYLCNRSRRRDPVERVPADRHHRTRFMEAFAQVGTITSRATQAKSSFESCCDRASNRSVWDPVLCQRRSGASLSDGTMAERPNASALKAEGFTPRGFKSLSFRWCFTWSQDCAYDLIVHALAGTDDFGLLLALGKDCAGALSFRPERVTHDDQQISEALCEQQIAALLRSLPTSPMGVEAGFRGLPAREPEQAAPHRRRVDGAFMYSSVIMFYLWR